MNISPTREQDLSDHTQLQYAYFDLPFVCPPTGERHGGSSFGSGQSVSLNLGEILRGDRIMTSDSSW